MEKNFFFHWKGKWMKGGKEDGRMGGEEDGRRGGKEEGRRGEERRGEVR